MKRLAIIAVILFLVYQWFYYSDPGNHSRKDLEMMNTVVPIDVILDKPRYPESPTLTEGKIIYAAGCRTAGICLIEYNSRKLIVLSRGFPPQQHQIITSILIPRRCLQIGNRYLTIAAMVAYKEKLVETR